MIGSPPIFCCLPKSMQVYTRSLKILHKMHTAIQRMDFCLQFTNDFQDISRELFLFRVRNNVQRVMKKVKTLFFDSAR